MLNNFDIRDPIWISERCEVNSEDISMPALHNYGLKDEATSPRASI